MSIIFAHKDKKIKPSEVVEYIQNLSLNTEDKFLELLEKAIQNEDFKEYEKIVKATNLKNMEPEIWLEIYSGDSRKEIEFWVNYPGRVISIRELNLINLKFNDLFFMGLKRDDLDLDLIDEVKEAIEDRIEELSKAENCKVIKGPVDYKGLKTDILYIDETGVVEFFSLGNSKETRVIWKDGSTKKVDFSKLKKILNERLDAILLL
jgi:hypothetical protein